MYIHRGEPSYDLNSGTVCAWMYIRGTANDRPSIWPHNRESFKLYFAFHLADNNFVKHYVFVQFPTDVDQFDLRRGEMCRLCSIKYACLMVDIFLSEYFQGLVIFIV